MEFVLDDVWIFVDLVEVEFGKMLVFEVFVF